MSEKHALSGRVRELETFLSSNATTRDELDKVRHEAELKAKLLVLAETEHDRTKAEVRASEARIVALVS